MKRSPMLALIISIAATIFLADYINKFAVKGAQIGGNNISKLGTLKALSNPDKYYWEMYPYSLGFSLIGGLVIFIIAFVLTPKKQTEK